MVGEASEEKPASALLTILVAEDEPINRKVAVKILEKLGHQVSVATNGVEAVDMALANAFDVIFMDIQMPEMDGLEATRVIREKAEGIHVPIIAMTAFTMRGDRESCLAAGMDGYLSKPLNFAELEEVIDEIARRPRRGPEEGLTQ